IIYDGSFSLFVLLNILFELVYQIQIIYALHR
ncbi:hypothetical protein, partial [Plasmodium yoelii yoelii]